MIFFKYLMLAWWMLGSEWVFGTNPRAFHVQYLTGKGGNP
jgi:hypothetical protein